jgi:hypothetical protein
VEYAHQSIFHGPEISATRRSWQFEEVIKKEYILNLFGCFDFIKYEVSR